MKSFYVVFFFALVVFPFSSPSFADTGLFFGLDSSSVFHSDTVVVVRGDTLSLFSWFIGDEDIVSYGVTIKSDCSNVFSSSEFWISYDSSASWTYIDPVISENGSLLFQATDFSYSLPIQGSHCVSSLMLIPCESCSLFSLYFDLTLSGFMNASSQEMAFVFSDSISIVASQAMGEGQDGAGMDSLLFSSRCTGGTVFKDGVLIDKNNGAYIVSMYQNRIDINGHTVSSEKVREESSRLSPFSLSLESANHIYRELKCNGEMQDNVVEGVIRDYLFENIPNLERVVFRDGIYILYMHGNDIPLTVYAGKRQYNRYNELLSDFKGITRSMNENDCIVFHGKGDRLILPGSRKEQLLRAIESAKRISEDGINRETWKNGLLDWVMAKDFD